MTEVRGLGAGAGGGFLGIVVPKAGLGEAIETPLEGFAVAAGDCSISDELDPAEALLLRSARRVVAPLDIFVELACNELAPAPVLALAPTPPAPFEGGVGVLEEGEGEGGGDAAPAPILFRGMALLTST